MLVSVRLKTGVDSVETADLAHRPLCASFKVANDVANCCCCCWMSPSWLSMASSELGQTDAITSPSLSEERPGPFPPYLIMISMMIITAVIPVKENPPNRLQNLKLRLFCSRYTCSRCRRFCIVS